MGLDGKIIKTPKPLIHHLKRMNFKLSRIEDVFGCLIELETNIL